jgi:hypothetical protein
VKRNFVAVMVDNSEDVNLFSPLALVTFLKIISAVSEYSVPPLHQNMIKENIWGKKLPAHSFILGYIV